MESTVEEDKPRPNFFVRWYDDFFELFNIVAMLLSWVIVTSINGWSQAHSWQAFGSSFVVFAAFSALRAWRKGRD